MQNAKPSCKSPRLIRRCRFVGMMQPPYEIIELKVCPFANVQCLTCYLFIPCAMIITSCHPCKQFTLLHNTKIPKMLWNLLLLHLQLPMLCKYSNFSFGCMILVLRTLFHVLICIFLASFINSLCLPVNSPVPSWTSDVSVDIHAKIAKF